jgi:hypothetical protein
VSAEAGRSPEALHGLNRALQLFQELSAADPKNAAAKADLVIGYRMAGGMLMPLDPGAAIERLTAASALAAQISSGDASDLEIRREMLTIFTRLGEACAAAAARQRTGSTEAVRYWKESRAWYERSLALSDDLRARGALSGTDADKTGLLAGLQRATMALGGNTQQQAAR